jgi:hypothetical protein
MSMKFRQLAFCLLAVAALVTFAAPATQATPAPQLSYSVTGLSGSPAAACANATAMINDRCDVHGPITTQSLGCSPLWGPNGEVIGQVCRCKATTSWCGILTPNPPGFP